jgi:4-hydroxy-3-methylbut-2-enyl diphosphate reductase
MSDVVVAAPLRIEAALISSAARSAAVRKTGMGPDRARAAAGGLDEDSVPGEVIIPEEVYDENHAEARVRCDLAPVLVSRLAGRGLKLRSGPIVCVSKIAVGERRAQLHAAGAIGVDMESVWLGAAAAGRPFGVVRVVLDSPSHELFRVRAVGQALRAAGALRRVAGALHEWTPDV